MTENYIPEGFRFPANSVIATGPSDTHQRCFSASYGHDSGNELDETPDDGTLVEILPRAGGTVNLAATFGGRSRSWFPTGSVDHTALASDITRKSADDNSNTTVVTNNNNTTNNSIRYSKTKRLKEPQNTSIFSSSVSLPSQQTMNFVAGFRDGQNSTPTGSLGSPREDEESKAMNMDASINPRMRASAFRRRTQNKQVRPSRNMTPHSGRTTPVFTPTTHLTAYRGSGIEEALTNLDEQDQGATQGSAQGSRRVSVAADPARLSPRPSVNDWSRSYSESIGVSSAEMARYFSQYRTPCDRVRQDSIPSTSEVSCTKSPQPNEITQSQIPVMTEQPSASVGVRRSKSSESELEQQVSDLQKRVSLLEGQNRSLHVQNQEYELRLQDLERKMAHLMPDDNSRREGTTSTMSPSPPRVPDATGSEEAPTRAPSKALTTTETTYTRV